MPKSSLPALLVCLLCPLALRGQSMPASEVTPSNKLTLPSATLIVLRFAEPLVGVPQFRMLVPVQHARVGDHVRLVVANDVRIEDVLVIRKGSLAQGTVTQADVPTRDYSDSGLEMRFDWIQSIDGEQIPIRQKHDSKKNESKGFAVNLFKTATGTHLGFGLEFRTWGNAFDEMLKVKARKQWTVIPTGTRVKAYTNGDFSLDLEAVKKAQADLPARNANATLTIYREKGPKDQKAVLACDGKELGELEDWQYVLLEMEPGKHSCQAKNGDGLDFSAKAGEELYFTLHHAKFSGKWKLTQVDSATAEDAIAFSDPLPDKQDSPPQASHQ